MSEEINNGLTNNKLEERERKEERERIKKESEEKSIFGSRKKGSTKEIERKRINQERQDRRTALELVETALILSSKMRKAGLTKSLGLQHRETGGSHSDAYQDCGLLGCAAV
jgi:hypothetical protein